MNDPDLVLETERLRLVLPGPGAAEGVLAYFVRNEAFHRPWDPPRPSDFRTIAFWRAQLARNRSEYKSDAAMRLFLFDRDDAASPVGQASFSTFIRGPFQACLLGYSLDRDAEGRGLMFEALSAAIAHVFDRLRLHRIMANHLVNNERSGRLLRRLGFEPEGLARHYLFIDGAWRDHVLNALTNPTPSPPQID